MAKPAIAVIIPAAGFGKRLGSPVAKQFLMVAGQSVLAHTVNKVHAWAQHYDHDIIIMVALSANSQLPNDVEGVHTCLGGKERADSVANALSALAHLRVFEWVMVHDAARPLIDTANIETLYQTLKQDSVGGILAEKVTATVKRASANNQGYAISATVPREDLWLAQTPQLFRFELLQQALSGGTRSHLTDEASAIEALGFYPKIVEGSRHNIKITTPDDWDSVQRYFDNL